MQVGYRTSQLEEVCTDARVASRKYGDDMARRIQLRIMQIGASSSVGEMVRLRVGRCHPLTGDRKGQYAMDLVHPFRLVFIVVGDRLQIAEIQEIVDYH